MFSLFKLLFFNSIISVFSLAALIDWFFLIQFSLVAQSCPTLWPHESQHARPPCPSPAPGVYSNSCPSSQWCHPAISSSVVPFSSCPQSLPASGSFPVSQLFTWGGQSTRVSASASFLPKKLFITQYNRDGKCETPASVPQGNTSGIISYYLWPSIQVNKDTASPFYSTQTPAALPILSLEPEMILLCHVCAKKGWYSLSGF